MATDLARLSPAALTTTGSENGLSELLSEVLGKTPPPSPFAERMATAARVAGYRALANAVGARYRLCSFDNYAVSEESTTERRPSQRDVYRAVLDFAERIEERMLTGGGLLLWGRPGTGKDHLLCACMYWAILKHGWWTRWIDGLTLYQRARDMIGQPGSEEDFLRQFTDPTILAISDPVPPKGDTSPYATELVQKICDRRYRDCKSTWATMNVVDGADAAARMASSIIDRMKDKSLCLECNWPSFRKALS